MLCFIPTEAPTRKPPIHVRPRHPKITQDVLPELTHCSPAIYTQSMRKFNKRWATRGEKKFRGGTIWSGRNAGKYTVCALASLTSTMQHAATGQRGSIATARARQRGNHPSHWSRISVSLVPDFHVCPAKFVQLLSSMPMPSSLFCFHPVASQ